MSPSINRKNSSLDGVIVRIVSFLILSIFSPSIAISAISSLDIFEDPIFFERQNVPVEICLSSPSYPVYEDLHDNDRMGIYISSPETIKEITPGAEETDISTKSNESGPVIEEAEEEELRIADPLAPFNRVMFHFNDRLYFWLIKPVTQVYSHIIPEDFRIVFNNVYDNLRSPIRIINHLLQLRLKAAGNELIRFLFNSFAGVGGMGDVAKDALGIKKEDSDFGQTLGHYGIGHGFYVILPFFGPSSLRDSVGIVGDRLMYPLTYLGSDTKSVEVGAGVAAHEKINDTSFRIGDYESFKESAIDPYISMRDAFLQHRKKKVDASH